MRVTTVFNRILGLIQASVCSVEFTDQGLVLGVARRRRRRYHCPCGFATRARYDTSRRRWRHLDFGATKVWLEATIARLDCPTCGVRTETVPWARPGARHTRDFQDVLGWLAQRMDKTSVARLLRCSWEAVDRAVKGLALASGRQPDPGVWGPYGGQEVDARGGSRLDLRSGVPPLAVTSWSTSWAHSIPGGRTSKPPRCHIHS